MQVSGLGRASCFMLKILWRCDKGLQALIGLSIVWPWYLVSTLLLGSERFTAFIMEDNGIIKALFHHKQPQVPAHLSLLNCTEETGL